MKTIAKAKQIGGSIGILIPQEIVKKERIHVNDTLKIEIEKTDDFSWLWGRGKEIKKSTDEIMKEIDEGELDE